MYTCNFAQYKLYQVSSRVVGLNIQDNTDINLVGYFTWWLLYLSDDAI